jgi:RNA polymerase sigma-70 factor (sigma-E family)
MAWLLTADWQHAEDLVQDALAKTWRHWRRVSAAEDVDAYVRRTIVNTFVSGRRRLWRHEHPTADPPEARTAEPSAAVETQIVVTEALVNLSRRQRTVVVLRYFEDLSIPDVARTLGWPVGTVKSTTSKALDRLREDARLTDLVEEVH